ncbi:30S ribosome-binding factor RbfA [Thermodesulfobacteriota bacterium]
MLAGKRAVRVGDQILKGIAGILMHEVRDPRVEGVTLTGIYLSNDLKHARVYFSVMGDKDDVIRAQSGLDSAKGYIKRGIGQRVKLKYVPDIIFEHDPTLEIGNQMERLFQKLRVKEPIETTE